MTYSEIVHQRAISSVKRFVRSFGIDPELMTATRRAELPHAVDAFGLTASFLGQEVFGAELAATRDWVQTNCTHAYGNEPIFDNEGSLVGRSFRFAIKAEADAFRQHFFGDESSFSEHIWRRRGMTSAVSA